MDDQQRARDCYMKYVDSSCGLGPNGDCHLWNGPQDARGYGKIGRKLATHIALELSGSQRPSTAHGALHSCDNPNCVNPSHLRWGTQKENAADASSRLRYPNVWKTHCPKGHEYTEENTILTQRREGWKDRKCRICANLRSKRRRAKHKEQRLAALSAAQGVTDDAVERAAKSLHANGADSITSDTPWSELHDGEVNQFRSWARAALLAARPQGVKDRPGIDGCTESNCKRCRTHPDHRGGMEHAGIGWRPDSPQEASDA